jgi:osmotically-inducible protein OsmY
MHKLALAVALALGGIGASFANPQNSGTTISQEVRDAKREAQIWTSYATNRHLRAFDLKVEVKGDTAILNGKVESGVARDLAEQIAFGTEDIKHVDNKIVVENNYTPPKRTERNFGDKVEDATITASVKSKLLWNSHTDGLDIHVDTNNGSVTLTGTAGSGAEKDLAGQLAHNTSGVVAVNNQIVIGPGKADKAKADMREAKQDAKATAHDAKVATKEAANDTKEAVSDAWITTKVKSTLLLTRNVDGLDIDVTTDNGVVKLSGEVDSPAERTRAIDLAQNIRGVKKVDPSGLKMR